MNDKKLPMGTKFNSHFGFVDLPSQILEVAIHEDHIDFECEDGFYTAIKNDNDDSLTIRKIK